MKISILTPSYNSVKYIQRAIESVLYQDYMNWEHIILDGNSNDGTQEILKKYDHLIWVSESDKGQSDAMNKAFRMSTGDIIVYLNADDWFEPNIFQEIVTQFVKYPELSVLVGNLYMRENKKPTRLNINEYRIKKIILPFKYGFPYNPVSYFYRREVQERVGEFPVSEHYAMDYWFILRAFTPPNVVRKSDLVFGNYLNTGENKTSTSSNSNLLSFAKESISNENNHLKFLFFLHYLLYKIFVLPKNSLVIILKTLIIIIYKRRWISFKTIKEKGIKSFLKHA